MCWAHPTLDAFFTNLGAATHAFFQPLRLTLTQQQSVPSGVKTVLRCNFIAVYIKKQVDMQIALYKNFLKELWDPPPPFT